MSLRSSFRLVSLALALSGCASVSTFFGGLFASDSDASDNATNVKLQNRNNLQDFDLVEGVTPTRMLLTLDVSPNAEAEKDQELATYEGSVEIELNIEKPTKTIVINAEDLEIKAIALDDNGSLQVPNITQGARSLKLQFKHTLRGKARLRAQFVGHIQEEPRGLYRVKENDENYLFTAFYPDNARRAFPCFDSPQFRVPFHLTLRIPEKMPALANGALERRATENSESEIDTVGFYETEPLPTHLLSWAIGPFELRGDRQSKGPRVITTWGKGRLADCALRTVPLLYQNLESTLGKLPYQKQDFLAQPQDSTFGEAIESPGLLTFPESILLLDEGHASFSRLQWHWKMVAQSLAHLWFGGVSSPKNADAEYLYEGFANYFALQAIESVEPALHASAYAHRDLQWLLAQNSLNVKESPAAMGAILAMIAGFSDEAKLKKVAESIISSGGVVSENEILDKLQATLNLDVRSILKAYENGVPEVNFSTSCEGGATKVGIQNAANIPICLRILEEDRVECALMPNDNVQLNIPGCGPIYPNAHGQGVYTWNLPAADILRLVQDDRLALEERVALPKSLDAALLRGSLDGTTYLQALEYLLQNDDPAVVEGALTSFAELTPIANRQGFSSTFALRLHDLLESKLATLDKSNEPDVENLHQHLESAMGFIAPTDAMIEEAEDFRSRFLEAPESVELEQASLVLPLAATHETADTQKQLIEKLDDASPVLRAGLVTLLASVHDAKLYRNALNLLLDGTLLPQELRPLLQSGLHPEESWAFLKAHRDELNEKLDDTRFMLPWMAAGLCTKQELDEVHSFFEPSSQDEQNSKGNQRLASELSRVEAQISDCIARKNALESALHPWLISPVIKKQ